MDARSLFPLTLAHLGDRTPHAQTPAEFVQNVCAAFAKGDIACRAARDLANYESLLLDLPTPAPLDPGPPRDDEPCVLAPHIRIIVYGAALPEMVAALRQGRPAMPRPARGWLITWRSGEAILRREEGWFLETFREPTPPSEAIEDDEDRTVFTKLWHMGILARAR